MSSHSPLLLANKHSSSSRIFMLNPRAFCRLTDLFFAFAGNAAIPDSLLASPRNTGNITAGKYALAQPYSRRGSFMRLLLPALLAIWFNCPCVAQDKTGSPQQTATVATQPMPQAASRLKIGLALEG